jgi:hypothetical protein
LAIDAERFCQLGDSGPELVFSPVIVDLLVSQLAMKLFAGSSFGLSRVCRDGIEQSASGSARSGWFE